MKQRNVPAGVRPVAVLRGDAGLPRPSVRADLSAAGPDKRDEVWNVTED